MNILIVGLGEVGFHLAKTLALEERHSVTVVDPNPLRTKRVGDAIDVRVVQGDGSRPDVLEKADAAEADLLLAVSNDDNVNMLSCLFGKRMGARKTVLRIKDMRPFHGFRTFFRRNLEFDYVLSLEELAATEIVKTIRQNRAVGVENFAEGKIQLRRLRLDEKSSFIGRSVADEKVPQGMIITAIDRAHEVIIPRGDHQFLPGDELLVLGEPDVIEKFEKRAGLQSMHLRRVAMFGSPSMIVHVFERLKAHRGISRITAIVPDREEAERLSTSVAGHGVNVLFGEATDRDLLLEEISDYDVFLGLSEADEVNLMSCQLAKDVGVQRTVALVHRPDYVGLYEQLGVTVAVSPRLLCAKSILAFVRKGSISTIAEIEAGKAEVIEVEIPKGSRLVDRSLREANFPKGCVVGAIARENGDIVVPRGDTVIEPLDNLVIFTLNEVIEAVLERTR